MKLKAVSRITLALMLIGMLMLAFNFKSVNANPQLIATTKLSISPAIIIGPPPSIGENFTVDICIEKVAELSSWVIGLKWNPAILECLSWTTNWGAGTPLGAESDWSGFDGKINNSIGEVVPPYVYSLKGGEIPKNGSGTVAQVNFTVLDYGFTWINLTWIEIKIGVDKTSIPVDVTNCSFRLPPPTALVANFTYSPSAPQPNRTVTFDASASVPGFNGTHNVPIANYTWDFGDGTAGTGIIATHTYTNPETYTVTLTIKDVAGNTATHQITVTVLSAEAFPMWVAGAVATIVAIVIAIVTVVFMKLKKKKQ